MSETNSITPQQVVNALGLTSQNQQVALTILAGSSLTGVDLAALGNLIKNEVGGNVSSAYGISPPTVGGNSGWTIGVQQSDFNTAFSASSTLLTNCLIASNMFTEDQANAISIALNDAGTSPNVDFPTGITVQSINNALSEPASQAILNMSADQQELSIASQIAAASTQISASNPALAAELTPASASFDPTAYIALVDYANEYGSFSINGPMYNLITTGAESFPGGVSYDIPPDQSLAETIQAGELSTLFADPSGTPNIAAIKTLDSRQAVQSSVGAEFSADNGVTNDLPENVTVSLGSQYLFFDQDGADDRNLSYSNTTNGTLINLGEISSSLGSYSTNIYKTFGSDGIVTSESASQYDSNDNLLETVSVSYSGNGLPGTATDTTYNPDGSIASSNQVNDSTSPGIGNTFTAWSTGDKTETINIADQPTNGLHLDNLLSFGAGITPSMITAKSDGQYGIELYVNGKAAVDLANQSTATNLEYGLPVFISWGVYSYSGIRTTWPGVQAITFGTGTNITGWCNGQETGSPNLTNLIGLSSNTTFDLAGYAKAVTAFGSGNVVDLGTSDGAASLTLLSGDSSIAIDPGVQASQVTFAMNSKASTITVGITGSNASVTFASGADITGINLSDGTSLSLSNVTYNSKGVGTYNASGSQARMAFIAPEAPGRSLKPADWHSSPTMHDLMTTSAMIMENATMPIEANLSGMMPYEIRQPTSLVTGRSDAHHPMNWH